MIIAEPQQVDSSDAASTNTLVTDEVDKLPRHLIKIVYASLLFSLLTFVFMLVAIVSTYPLETAATIIAFLLTLPHHGALVLLQWLQRHQTDSIFPFTPHSPRAIAYLIFLALAWSASTVMCSIRLFMTSREYWMSCSYHMGADGFPDPPNGPLVCINIPINWGYYWSTILSTALSALELVLIISITVICWLHRRPKKRPAPPPPSSSSPVQAEAKVLSA